MDSRLCLAEMIQPSRPAVLPSLDALRADLRPVARPRASMKGPLLVATLAAVAGVLAAAVMILGPTGAVPLMSEHAFVQSETR